MNDPHVIVDTIYVNESSLAYEQAPEAPWHGVGVVAVLKPEVGDVIFPALGSVAIIEAPNGEQLKLTIDGCGVLHSVPWIFFSGLIQRDIPIGSTLSW
jgi:hypothetical protein